MIKIFTTIIEKVKIRFYFLEKFDLFTSAIILNILVAFYINFICDQNNIALFISDILKVSTLIIAAQQFYLSQKDYQTSNEHLEKKEATDLVKYYQEEILPLISLLTPCFYNNDIQNLNKSFQGQLLKHFSYTESQEFLKCNNLDSDQYIKEYYGITQSPVFLMTYTETLCALEPSANNKFYHETVIIFGKVSNKEEHIKELEYRYLNVAQELSFKKIDKQLKSTNKKFEELTQEEKDKIDKEVNSEINSLASKEILEITNEILTSYHTKMTTLLNKLEYFSMCFNTGVADETVAYQSLQQTYTSTVEQLYPHITKLNRDPKNKYFTNIIKLYNLWNTRYLEYVEKEKQLFDNEEERLSQLEYEFKSKVKA